MLQLQNAPKTRLEYAWLTTMDMIYPISEGHVSVGSMNSMMKRADFRDSW